MTRSALRGALVAGAVALAFTDGCSTTPPATTSTSVVSRTTTSGLPSATTERPTHIYGPVSEPQAEKVFETVYGTLGLGYARISSLLYWRTSPAAVAADPTLLGSFLPPDIDAVHSFPSSTPTFIFQATGTFQVGRDAPCSPPYAALCGPPFRFITWVVVGSPVFSFTTPLEQSVPLTRYGAGTQLPASVWQHLDHDNRPGKVPG